MILTVTPNPTIDRVMFVRDFAMQDVVRAEREAVSASGKAIDVSAILHLFGVDTVALGLNAGLSGGILEVLLEEAGVPYEFVAADGYTRVAALITDIDTGRQSTILANTLLADESHLEKLQVIASAHMLDCWGMVCAGSLPPGLPPDTYARLLTAATERGLVTLLDSSGEGLRNGVKARPDVLKLNRSELAALSPHTADVWQEDNAQRDVHRAASELADALEGELVHWARQAVVVTLGRQGSVAVTPDGRWFVPALSVPVVSPAGAGDGMTSGIMLALFRRQCWQEALALGTAVAASVVMNVSTSACDPNEVGKLVHQVEVTEV